MPESAIGIRRAGAEDVPVVTAILHEAADWLSAQGMPMWATNELDPDDIAKAVVGRMFYLAEFDGQPAGTIKFQLVDREFWPEIQSGDSAFVHRLAVRRKFAGRGVSTALLTWAADHARSLGLSYLRLDCEASRHKLRAIYERLGFRHYEDRHVGPYFVALYTLDLSAHRTGPRQE